MLFARVVRVEMSHWLACQRRTTLSSGLTVTCVPFTLPPLLEKSNDA